MSLPVHCPTALGSGPDGWGEYHPAALELARGVDLPVHDARLLPEELAAQAAFGHSAADYPVEFGGPEPKRWPSFTTGPIGPTMSSMNWLGVLRGER